ncbi:isoprenylcysteine carboxylmethyltransferase family protein [Gammaproteobacteria bacterium]|nr:isoprenylcysteine carboxylmethyltransferase family protein [Gammaproteobacteria bacterium]
MESDIPLAILSQWEYIVLTFAAASIISGVVINFVNKANQPGGSAAKERNIVATWTMSLFFVGMFIVGRLDIGRIPLSDEAELTSKLTGCLLVLVAATLNIAGRIALGRFWSDQIEVQEEHQVVRKWPYSWSRHPLYGSLVIFGIGMGLLAINPIVVTTTVIIFVPAMRYRARREEAVLVDACGDEYRRYQSDVAMMLPRLPESLSKAARAGIAAIQVWGAMYQLLDVFLLSAALTLCLSFIMERDDFRIAYKIKPVVIVVCVALAALYSTLTTLLWIPALSSLMSLTGQCPGTLIVRAVKRHQGKVLA